MDGTSEWRVQPTLRRFSRLQTRVFARELLKMVWTLPPEAWDLTPVKAVVDAAREARRRSRRRRREVVNGT